MLSTTFQVQQTLHTRAAMDLKHEEYSLRVELGFVLKRRWLYSEQIFLSTLTNTFKSDEFLICIILFTFSSVSF